MDDNPRHAPGEGTLDRLSKTRRWSRRITPHAPAGTGREAFSRPTQRVVAVDRDRFPWEAAAFGAASLFTVSWYPDRWVEGLVSRSPSTVLEC